MTSFAMPRTAGAWHSACGALSARRLSATDGGLYSGGGRQAMIDHSEFKQGMRRLAAGVSVVTTMDGAQPHGFSATSVTSVSADPAPLLLVCVNKAVSCHDI